MIFCSSKSEWLMIFLGKFEFFCCGFLNLPLILMVNGVLLHTFYSIKLCFEVCFLSHFITFRVGNLKWISCLAVLFCNIPFVTRGRGSTVTLFGLACYECLLLWLREQWLEFIVIRRVELKLKLLENIRHEI